MPESASNQPQVSAGQMVAAALFVVGFALGGAGLAFARKSPHLSRGLEVAAMALFAAASLVVVSLALREAWLRGKGHSGDFSHPTGPHPIGVEMRLPQDAGAARGLPWYWGHEALPRGGGRLYLSGQGRSYIALLMSVLLVGSLLFAAVGLHLVLSAPARADWHAWAEAVVGPLASLFFLTALLGALGGTEWRLTRNSVELSTSYVVWVRVQRYADAAVELAPGRLGPLVFSEPRNVNLITRGRRIRLVQGSTRAEGLRLAALVAYHTGWPLYAAGEPLPPDPAEPPRRGRANRTR